MNTSKHTQTLTNITMPNKATHPLAHWLCGFLNRSFCFLVWSLYFSLLFSRLLMFDSRQGRGPNPRVPSRPFQALLLTIPPEQVGRGGGVCYCQRNAQRGTISNTLYPWAQHQFLLITVLSAVALFKQLVQMLMSSNLHIYIFFVEMSLIIMFYGDECLCWCTLICN